jgi:hypothetical protein
MFTPTKASLHRTEKCSLSVVAVFAISIFAVIENQQMPLAFTALGLQHNKH